MSFLIDITSTAQYSPTTNVMKSYGNFVVIKAEPLGHSFMNMFIKILSIVILEIV